MDMINLNPQNHTDAWWQHLIIFTVAGVLGYIIGYRTSADTATELEEELDSVDAELGDCQASKEKLATKATPSPRSLLNEPSSVESPATEVTGFKDTPGQAETDPVSAPDLNSEEIDGTLENHTSKLGVGAMPMATPQPKAAASKRDNLKKVEGIGPKIQELLNKQGIMTFRQLSETSPETLTTILRDAGTRFQMHDPGTWPKQAELAADGKWDELAAWQSELDKGRAS